MSQSELIAIKDAIDGIYKNEIYDKEYTFEESKYIIKDPMIHLDVDKILEDLKNSCCEIKNISEDDLQLSTGLFETRRKRVYTNINFPISKTLMTNEFIIKILINKNTIKDIRKTEIYYLVLITNYGRIIKTDEINFYNKFDSFNGCMGMVYQNDAWCNNINVILNKNLCYIGKQYIWSGPNRGNNFNINQLTINLIEQPKLLYRIPKLFLDVIDAFHTQNTDLMQKCCKQYLEISRESKVKESIMKDIKIKEINEEKDIIIKEKDKIIEEKDKEIDDLKIKLEILQQKYDKIKAMFE